VPTAPDTLAALGKRPAHFTLGAAVEALQDARPGTVPVGFLGPVAEEAVRLRPRLSLAFPDADIAGVEPEGGHWLLTTTVLGLYGESSPLPTSYTEQLMALDEPNAARALLDIINHRMLSFLVRALVKYRLRGDAHTGRFAALLGQDPAGGGAANAALLVCAGCFAHRGGSAAGIEAALGWWFTGLPVRVDTCVPTWTPIAEEQRSRLGGANVRMGSDALLGGAIRNRGLTVRIEVRPRDPAEFTAFLPGGAARAELAVLVAASNPSRLDMELDVVVDGAAVPPATMGGGARLGYDTRLGGRPSRENRIRLQLDSTTTTAA
jgi:type VI secretion system protein ImpH